MQHAVGELGVLRDVAQAGVRVPLLGQGQQRGRGELVAPLGELVYLAAGDPLASRSSTSVNSSSVNVQPPALRPASALVCRGPKITSLDQPNFLDDRQANS